MNRKLFPNNSCLNFIGNIDLKFIESILKDNFLSLEQSKSELSTCNINNSCENTIKRKLFGKYFYYGFNLAEVSMETQLIGLLLMNEITAGIREIVRSKERDGYFNFTDINWDLGYLFLHIGSFSMENKKFVSIIKDFLQIKNFFE